MSDIIVCKFGGSSLTCEEDVERLRKILGDDARRKIVVVSAPGKRNKKDEKATDLLIALADAQDEQKKKECKEKILERYMQLHPAYPVDNILHALDERISADLEKRWKRNGENEKMDDCAYLDAMKAFGEEMSARVIAQALGARFVDARELLMLNSDYGKAKILDESEQAIRKRLSGLSEVIVIPGFYGATKSGAIATLSRGGSDLTGAYIAGALEASIYENFTDKDGVFAADPELVENPKHIKELTYKEMRDLSYSGFKIYQQEAIAPVEWKNVPVHIRNTFMYPSEGTYIVADRISNPIKPIVGIAYKSGFCRFVFERRGMNEEVGVFKKIFSIFAERNLSIEFPPPAGIDGVSLVLAQGQFSSGLEINAIINEVVHFLGKKTLYDFQDNLGCLVIAGKNLGDDLESVPTIPRALKEEGIFTRFYSDSDDCVIYGIDAADGRKAVNVIYEKYVK